MVIYSCPPSLGWTKIMFRIMPFTGNYILTSWIKHIFWLVLSYDLLEDRSIHETITFGTSLLSINKYIYTPVHIQSFSKTLQFESIYKIYIYIYIYIFLFSQQKDDEPCMCISHSYEAIRNWNLNPIMRIPKIIHISIF